MKLTIARIAELECPPGKRDRLVFDDEQKGLAVRVTAGGSKSYLVQYSFHGQKRRLPLGSVDAISLKAARDAAQVAMGQVAKGVDPVGERAAGRAVAKQKAAESSLTLATLIDDWRSLRLGDRRRSYAQEAVRALRRAFAKDLDEPAIGLTRANVVRTLDALSREGADAMASRTAAYGRACYSWATKRGTVTSNPFENLPAASIKKRERVLSDDELVAVWRATEGQGSFNRIVRMLVLTGQRRDEVAGMTWNEVSSDMSVWMIPGSRAKNGAAHIVPLPQPVVDLLHSAPRMAELVFPGARVPRGQAGGELRPIGGWSKAKAALDARSGVKDWRLHDLRRTMATGLQRLGIRLEVTEQILNHVSGSRAGIVGIYQRHDFAHEKREALETWGTYVMGIVDSEEYRGRSESNDELEDTYAPAQADLETFASLLRDANPRRTRYRGVKGDALKELAEIEERLGKANLSADDRRKIGNQLERLNGTYVVRNPTGVADGEYQSGPLGVGRFPWAPAHRRRGTTSSTVDQPLDSELLQLAVAKISSGLKPGAALREVVMGAKRDGQLNGETESHVKTLRRKGESKKLFPKT